MHTDASLANAPNCEVGEYQGDMSLAADKGVVLVDGALCHTSAAVGVDVCDNSQVFCLA